MHRQSGRFYGTRNLKQGKQEGNTVGEGTERVIKRNNNIFLLPVRRGAMYSRAKGYEHALLTKSQRKDVPLNIRRNKFLDTQNENDVDYIYGLNSVCAVLKKNERELYTVMVRQPEGITITVPYPTEIVYMNRSIKLDRKIHKHTYNYVLNTIRERNIKTIAMDKRHMDELVGGFPHNDIIMKGSYRYMQHYSSFIKNIDSMVKHNRIYICLHDIYDNMNIGNICRSVFFFGGNCIFLKKKKKQGEKKNKVKIDTPILHASVGASEFLNLFHVNNMANFMSEMKQKGFTIYATCCRDSHTGNNFIELKNAQIGKNDKALIILGNESKGLCEDIIKNSDVCIYINNINNEEFVSTSSLTENSHLIMNSLNMSIIYFFHDVLNGHIHQCMNGRKAKWDFPTMMSIKAMGHCFFDITIYITQCFMNVSIAPNHFKIINSYNCNPISLPFPFFPKRKKLTAKRKKKNRLEEILHKSNAAEKTRISYVSEGGVSTSVIEKDTSRANARKTHPILTSSFARRKKREGENARTLTDNHNVEETKRRRVTYEVDIPIMNESRKQTTNSNENERTKTPSVVCARIAEKSMHKAQMGCGEQNSLRLHKSNNNADRVNFDNAIPEVKKVPKRRGRKKKANSGREIPIEEEVYTDGIQEKGKPSKDFSSKGGTYADRLNSIVYSSVPNAGSRKEVSISEHMQVSWEEEKSCKNVNVDTKERANVDTKEGANVDTKERANVDTKERANVDTKERANVDTKEGANVDTKERANVDAKEGANVDAKEGANIDDVNRQEKPCRKTKENKKGKICKEQWGSGEFPNAEEERKTRESEKDYYIDKDHHGNMENDEDKYTAYITNAADNANRIDLVELILRKRVPKKKKKKNGLLNGGTDNRSNDNEKNHWNSSENMGEKMHQREKELVKEKNIFSKSDDGIQKDSINEEERGKNRLYHEGHSEGNVDEMDKGKEPMRESSNNPPQSSSGLKKKITLLRRNDMGYEKCARGSIFMHRNDCNNVCGDGCVYYSTLGHKNRCERCRNCCNAGGGKTLEQREKEYNKIRARIFSNFNKKKNALKKGDMVNNNLNVVNGGTSFNISNATSEPYEYMNNYYTALKNSALHPMYSQSGNIPWYNQSPVSDLIHPPQYNCSNALGHRGGNMFSGISGGSSMHSAIGGGSNMHSGICGGSNVYSGIGINAHNTGVSNTHNSQGDPRSHMFNSPHQVPLLKTDTPFSQADTSHSKYHLDYQNGMYEISNEQAVGGTYKSKLSGSTNIVVSHIKANNSIRSSESPIHVGPMKNHNVRGVGRGIHFRSANRNFQGMNSGACDSGLSGSSHYAGVAHGNSTYSGAMYNSAVYNSTTYSNAACNNGTYDSTPCSGNTYNNAYVNNGMYPQVNTNPSPNIVTINIKKPLPTGHHHANPYREKNDVNCYISPNKNMNSESRDHLLFYANNGAKNNGRKEMIGLHRGSAFNSGNTGESKTTTTLAATAIAASTFAGSTTGDIAGPNRNLIDGSGHHKQKKKQRDYSKNEVDRCNSSSMRNTTLLCSSGWKDQDVTGENNKRKTQDSAFGKSCEAKMENSHTNIQMGESLIGELHITDATEMGNPQRNDDAVDREFHTTKGQNLCNAISMDNRVETNRYPPCSNPTGIEQHVNCESKTNATNNVELKGKKKKYINKKKKKNAQNSLLMNINSSPVNIMNSGIYSSNREMKCGDNNRPFSQNLNNIQHNRMQQNNSFNYKFANAHTYQSSYHPQVINDPDFCRDISLYEKRYDKGDTNLLQNHKRYDVDFPSLH
ncbi:apicoplast RNA methyltransferase precursor, putative [Plasmodium ovale curtisi]|uniref:Apicoplast RNA methyltransferase, putative n=1 Tax=Plasmodium ovale curtisi TaxID=864141 RepID=A0A1A8VJW0_PLAOA|nr:apicoplast RNA methyltransferase precursor, putative [Plasmodium ovale curtisi]